MLAEKVLNGNKWATSRLISHVENRHPQVQEELAHLYPHTGRASLIGITGAPGTGKSSLVNQLAKTYRGHDKRVAVLAVDPTSPFSGGAVLGDRIRMQDLSGDPGVFIRSMATRGSLGGLAGAVNDALKILDAAGYEIILIETVGAGQSEVDIVRTVHTVLVIEAPGLGDDVQAIKAGILEIADIFVVNKADRPGADRTASSLKRMLELGQPTAQEMLHLSPLARLAQETRPSANGDAWQVPIIKTMALQGDGIAEVVAAIDRHGDYLRGSGQLAWRNRHRLTNELQTILQAELMSQLLKDRSENDMAQVIEQVVARKLSPFQAAQQLLK